MGGKEFSGGDNNRDELLFLLDAIKMERDHRLRIVRMLVHHKSVFVNG